MSFGPCNNCCALDCGEPIISNARLFCIDSKTSGFIGDPDTADPLREPDWDDVRDDAWECGTSYTPHDDCDDASKWTLNSGLEAITFTSPVAAPISTFESCPTGTLDPLDGSEFSSSACLFIPGDDDDSFRVDGHAGRSATIQQCMITDETLLSTALESTASIRYAVFVLLQPVAATKTMQSDCGVHKIRWHYRLSIESGDFGRLPATYVDNFSREHPLTKSSPLYHCTTDTITNSNISFRRGSVSDPDPVEDAIQQWLDGTTGSDGTVTPNSGNSISTHDSTGITGLSVGANDYIFQLIAPNAACYTSNPLDTWPGQPTYDWAVQHKITDPIRSIAIQKVEYLDASDVLVWSQEFFEV